MLLQNDGEATAGAREKLKSNRAVVCVRSMLVKVCAGTVVCLGLRSSRLFGTLSESQHHQCTETGEETRFYIASSVPPLKNS